MQHRQPRLCKFGQNCNKLAQGNCTFLHPNQQGQSNRTGNPNMGQNQNQNQNMNPRSSGPRGQNYDQQNFPNNNRGNFNQGDGGSSGWGSQHGNYGKQYNQREDSNPNPNKNSNYTNPNLPPKGDQFSSKFCMSYHFNQPCKFQQRGNCSRIHGFDQQGKIRRVAFLTDIPPKEPSKLGKFVSNGQTFLILRMGNGIAVLTFDQETGQFSSQKTWEFPKPELNYTFYSQKQNFIYFSAQNPKTSLHDIGIYDMLNDVLITIIQAHASNVTQVIHFSDSIILSSSKDGQIRVWKIEGTKATLDKESTQGLFKLYNTGKKMEILFLDLSVVNGMKVLSAGTNDNRILFFLGDQMQYQPLVLPQRHAQSYKIRYCTIGEVTIAFAITWTQDSKQSAVIAINLSDLTQVSEIVKNSTSQNPRNNIYLIQVIEERLFVATLGGLVTVYSLPKVQKIGIMLHKNPVNSIVSSQYVTQTNIKIPRMFVLESRYLEKPGSIGVYTLKK